MNISRDELAGGPAETDWRELDTTPEFRQFVARKLDQLVGGMLKEKDRWKHLQPLAVEGHVRLFAGAPPLEVTEEMSPEPPPPAKRPRLAGVDLQRYQLKKKSRRDRDKPEGGKQSERQTAPAPAAEVAADDVKLTSSPVESGTAPDGKGGDCESSDSGSDSDDDELARFEEAAVPAEFMSSLAKSKTVKLDSA